VIDGVERFGVRVLVTGRTRLEALKLLGRSVVDSLETDADDIEAELWEISENLDRAELTVAEHSAHVARKLELLNQRQDVVSRQSDAKPPAGGRPKGGVRAAARAIGISEADARRAVKVASLTDDAKRTAKEVGLDDNRSALLHAADAPPEQQAAFIRQIAEEKRRPKGSTEKVGAALALVNEALASVLNESLPGLGGAEAATISSSLDIADSLLKTLRRNIAAQTTKSAA
jgi:hypothetical protein